MYVFHQFGWYVIKLVHSIQLFLCFIGHLSSTIINVLRGRLSISRQSIINTLFYSGFKLAMPLMIISALMGMTIVINISNFLSKFNVQYQAWILAQDILTHNLVPIVIAVFLCIQSALSLTRALVDKSHKVSEDVVLIHILPIIIGINISGALLYIYCLAMFYLSIYFSIIYILKHPSQHYFIHLTEYLSLSTFIFSILKTALYCSIVSITIGYYYYLLAFKNHSLDKAISQIITRGLVWLIICSAFLNFITF